MFSDGFPGVYDPMYHGGDIAHRVHAQNSSSTSENNVYRDLYLNQCDNMLLLQSTIQQHRLDQRINEERIREQERIDRDRWKYEDRIFS